MDIIRKLSLFIIALCLTPIMWLAIIVWTALDCFHEHKATKEMVDCWLDCLLWRV